MNDRNPFLRTAEEAAREAGSYLLERFRRQSTLQIDSKGFHDYVTDVDRAAEEIILELIGRRFPDHAVMAEEGTPEAMDSSHRWIVDPLDGTTNFIHGVPFFAVSVALQDSDGLLAGVVHDPSHRETFCAERGRGATCNGDPIRCSRITGLNDALLATGLPFRYFHRLDGYMKVLRELMQTTCGIRRAGSAALDLAYTACGRFDGFWETGLSPWDMAAGALLVREAGGVVVDFAGGPGFLENGEIVASSAGIHQAVMEIIRRHME